MYAAMLMTKGLFLLVAHERRGRAGNGLGVDGSNRQPLRLGAIRPSSVYNSDFGEQSEEQDSQVQQRLQARERLLGHGADLVPLQEPGEGKNKQNPTPQSKPDQFQTWLVRCHAAETYSFFSFSRAEKGPFMSSMVQEISFFWRSL